MSDAIPLAQLVCPECGGTIPAGAKRCWLCHGSSGQGTPRSQARMAGTASGNPFVDEPAPRFGFALGLAAIAVGAVLLGVSLLAPGLGILLALIVIPLFLRICFTTSRTPVRSEPMSAGKAVAVAGASLGMALLVALGTIVAIVVAAVIAVLSICSSILQAGHT